MHQAVGKLNLRRSEMQEKPLGGRTLSWPTGELTAFHQTPCWNWGGV